jgi:alcohol dehydrogenase
VAQAVAAVGGAGAGGVALVIDEGLEATPWPEQVRGDLAAAGIACRTFGGVENNPRAETVEQIADSIREEGLAPVVGLGGGSVLDAAKAAAMLATNSGTCASFQGKERYTATPLPLIAIPTTCGTGSEVTWVSVISLPDRREKISIKGTTMFPDWALVDADLVATLPSHLVAWTGLDALTHALEAMTVNVANPVSDALATEAVRLLLAHLESAVAGEGAGREAVMRASTLAGIAFGNADVGAVHCLSETLGGLFDVHHGLTNALLLVPTLKAHGASIAPPLHALATRLCEPGGASGILDRVEALVERLQLPFFATLQIPKDAYPEIAERATQNGSNPSNLREMGVAEYLAILGSL